MSHQEPTFCELIHTLETARAKLDPEALVSLAWVSAMAASLDYGTPLLLSDSELILFRQSLIQRARDTWAEAKSEGRIPWAPGTIVWLITGSPPQTVTSDADGKVKVISFVTGAPTRVTLPPECWTDVEPLPSDDAPAPKFSSDSMQAILDSLEKDTPADALYEMLDAGAHILHARSKLGFRAEPAEQQPEFCPCSVCVTRAPYGPGSPRS